MIFIKITLVFGKLIQESKATESRELNFFNVSEKLFETTHSQILNLDNIVVLIPRDDGDDGGPVATHVVNRERHLASVDVDVGLRLEPSRQPSAGSVGKALHKVAQEQPLVLVAAEGDDSVESLKLSKVSPFLIINAIVADIDSDAKCL